MSPSHSRLPRWLRAFGEGALGLIYPRNCVGCEAVLGEDGLTLDDLVAGATAMCDRTLLGPMPASSLSEPDTRFFRSSGSESR